MKVFKGDKQKRPATSYILFCKDFRPKMVDKHPEYDNKQITKSLAELWKNSTPTEREKYIKEAEVLKKENRENIENLSNFDDDKDIPTSTPSPPVLIKAPEIVKENGNSKSEKKKPKASVHRDIVVHSVIEDPMPKYKVPQLQSVNFDKTVTLSTLLDMPKDPRIYR